MLAIETRVITTTKTRKKSHFLPGHHPDLIRTIYDEQYNEHRISHHAFDYLVSILLTNVSQINYSTGEQTFINAR